MSEGWIKLHRKILENPIVCKDSDHLALWIYLLTNATHTEYDSMFKGKRITLQPGQLLTGRKAISTFLKVNENKVQRILKLFQEEQQIEQQTSNQNRLITILNWSLYQSNEQQSEQQVNTTFGVFGNIQSGNMAKSEQQINSHNVHKPTSVRTCQSDNEQQVNNDRTTTEQRVNTNKNVKNIKNENNYQYIVEYLNQKTGKNFSHKAKSTTAKIHTRLEEGFTVDDFKKVIDIKTSEWLDDSNMQKYLRPETLFGTKFEGYLNQSVGSMKVQKDKQTPNQDHVNHNYDMDELEKTLWEKQIGGGK